jgi:hypothetical protein
MQLNYINSLDRVLAVQGFLKALAGAGVIRCNQVLMCSIEEGVKVNHVTQHIVGPFDDLRLDVDKKGIQGSMSKDNCLCKGVVHDEEGHGASLPDGRVIHLMGSIPKNSRTLLAISIL